MKKFIRSGLWLLLLIGFSLEARVPAQSLKDIASVFKPGKRAYVPSLGLIAIDSGIIHNLRFYWDYKRGFDTAGVRSYLKDLSTDSLWQVVRLLFPSQGGIIASSSPADTNFGRYATPKAVAALINHAYSQRENEPQTLDDSSLLQLMSTQALKSEKRKNLKKQTLKPLLDAIRLSISEESIKGLPTYLTELMLLAFFAERFNDRSQLLELLGGLDDRIVDKAKLNLLKPDDVISEADLDSAIATASPSLDDMVVIALQDALFGILPYPPGSQPIEMADAQSYDRASDKISAVLFSDCVENTLRHFFNLAFYDPAKRTFDLGAAHNYAETHGAGHLFANMEDFYQIQNPSMVNSRALAIRSAWNRVVGDLNADQKEPHIAYVLASSELDTGFVNFVRVVQKLLGATLPSLPQSKEARDRWIEESLKTMLTAINPGRIYDVKLDAGLLFSISSPSGDKFSFELSSDSKHMQIGNLKVEGSDIKVPSSTATLDVAANTTEEILLGAVKAWRDKLSPPLFKLWQRQLSVYPGRVAFLEEYRDLAPNLIAALKKDALSAIGFILDDFEWSDERALRSFAKVWGTLGSAPDMAPMNSRLRGWYVVNEETRRGLYDKSKEFHPEILFSTYPNVEHLFIQGDIPMEDEWPDSASKLKTLSIKSNSFFEPKGMSKLVNLQSLIVHDGLGALSLQGLNNLSSLDLSFSGVWPTDLTGSPKLTALNLSNNKGVDTLDLSPLPNLEKLNLKESAIREIIGLDKAKSLATLNLAKTRLSSPFEMENMPQLRELNLSDTEVPSVRLVDLPRLETLYVERNKSLESLELKKLPSLKRLNASYTGVKIPEYNILVSGRDMPELEELDLDHVESLEGELIFEDFPKLREISLKESSVENVVIIDCEGLEQLLLSFTEKLSNLFIFGPQLHLKKILAIASNIKEVQIDVNSYQVDPKDLEFNFSSSKNLSLIEGLRKHFPTVETLNIELNNTKLLRKDIQ